jgi:caffeoyl-CoA O-methyltransferase
MSLRTTAVNEEIESYINLNFIREDKFLKNLLKEAASLNIPEISISPQQGAFLQFLLRAIGAKYVMEIGSLAGYSAITMAKVLPKDGKLVSLEVEPSHAAFIRNKAAEAGLEGVIEVVNSEAVRFLKSYKPPFHFDLIFIDADKESYPDYLNFSIQLLRKGGIVIADNALAWGLVYQDKPVDKTVEVKAIRKFNDALSANPQLQSCLLTIGDGMAMGVKL